MAGYGDYLDHKLKEELSKHNSQQTAWYSEAKQKQQKWFKEWGIKTLLAEWTEETKTWVWLENPDKHLSTGVSLKTADGRINFSVDVRAKVRFKAWGKIPNVLTADVRGRAWAEIQIAGSTAVEPGGLADSRIDVTEGRLSDVRWNNDALNALHGLAQRSLNNYIKDNEKDLKQDLVKAIDNVTF